MAFPYRNTLCVVEMAFIGYGFCRSDAPKGVSECETAYCGSGCSGATGPARQGSGSQTTHTLYNWKAGDTKGLTAKGDRVNRIQSGANRSNYWVPILGSAMRILDVFYDADSDLTLHEISAKAKVGKTSAFRILFTLDSVG